MKHFLLFLFMGMVMAMAPGMGLAANFTFTAGDIDFGADRDAYDISANMDFFVFGSTQNPIPAHFVATNVLGWVAWDYVLPFEIEAAHAGAMTVRAWDIDSTDRMDVYFNFGAERIFAGELTGSNGGNWLDWENAVAAGSTSDLDGWSTTAFSFSPELLGALGNTDGFYLEVDVQNEGSSDFAAVIDYAAIDLEYTPGNANPTVVPEPSTWLLMGAGLLGLMGIRRKMKK